MRQLLGLFLGLTALGCVSAPAGDEAPTTGRTDPAAVSTADPIATHVGLDVLAAGGNAADAAVAVGFALAVVYPAAGNLGGGGFAVTFRPGDPTAEALDFRETAPSGAARDMYLDADGNVVARRSRSGHLAVGVPGSVAGMWALHQRLGRMAWPDLLAPAIELADGGFEVSEGFGGELRHMAERLQRHPATARQFLHPDGSPYVAGETLRQPELAATLRAIAERGPEGFYRGDVADAVVAEMERGGGLITHDDLAGYEARWREVVRVEFRGRSVWSMAPPSSGGICLGMILRSLATLEPRRCDLDTPAGVHRYVEACRRAYADRATHLGDSDYWEVPRAWLLSEAYASEQCATITDEATPSADVRAEATPRYEGEETTHYSVLDGDGFAVSVTTTLNFGYGSRITVPGGGFLLNNEMDDFSAKPGVPNAYGLVGAEANAVAPGKRMLSSMSPTIVTRDGAVELVCGTPGGATIITSVAQCIVRVIDMGQTLESAVGAPRLHHQWLPDQVSFEEGRPPTSELLDQLQARGHAVKGRGLIGDVCAIHVTADSVHAVADDRRRGAAGVFLRLSPWPETAEGGTITAAEHTLRVVEQVVAAPRGVR